MDGYYDKNDINRMHEDLKEQMHEGFIGINRRLDILNGQVAKNTKNRYILMGMGAIFTLIVIPIAVNFINTKINQKDRQEDLTKAVEEVLQNYELEIVQ